MKNIQYINAGAGSGKTTKLTQILSEELGKKDDPIRPSEVILTISQSWQPQSSGRSHVNSSSKTDIRTLLQSWIRQPSAQSILWHLVSFRDTGISSVCRLT